MDMLGWLFRPDIARLEQEGHIPDLVRAAQHPDPEVRYASTCALLRLGAIDALIPAAAAYATLTQALQDPDPSVRRLAAAALGQARITGIAERRQPKVAPTPASRHRGAVKPICAALQAVVSTDGDQGVRQAAAEALGRLGDGQAVAPLVASLQDPISGVRQAAAEALHRLGWKPGNDLELSLYLVARREWPRCAPLGRPVVEPLVAVLKDPDQEVRQAAARLLVQIGTQIGTSVIEPLIAALHDADRSARHAVTQVLVQIGIQAGAPSVEPLIATLQDADSNVRQAAAQALGQIGELQANMPVPSTTDIRQANARVRRSGQALSRSPERAGRPSEESANGFAADTFAANAFAALRAIEPLGTLLKDPDRHVRQAARQALAQIGYPAQVNALAARLQDTDARVRWRAAYLLRQLGDREAIKPLVDILVDVASDVRQLAAEALDKLDWKPETDMQSCLYAIAKRDWPRCVQMGEPAVDPLIAILQDADGSARQAAAQALGQIGDARAVQPLVAALSDVDSRVRRPAAWALGQIGERSAASLSTRPLIASLQDPAPKVRAAAAAALGHIGDPGAVQPLIAILHDKAVCRAAIAALVRIGGPAVAALAAALHSGGGTQSAGDVRYALIQALIQIGKPAVRPLIAVLESADHPARRHAAYALGKIGDPDAVSLSTGPLVAALADADATIRQTAAEALDALDWKPGTVSAGVSYLIAKQEWPQCIQVGAPAVAPLTAMLRDAEEGVRQEAAYALGRIGDGRAIEPLLAVLAGVRSSDLSRSRSAAPNVRWDVVGALRRLSLKLVSEPGGPRVKAILARSLSTWCGQGLIVCIDDSLHAIEAVQLVLETHGFSVLGAMDGVTGVERVRLTRPDLILLDLMMPGMDGWAVYCAIKADDDLERIPIIVLSATHVRELDTDLAARDSYVTKPFTGEEILAAVGRALGGRRWE